MSYRVVYYGQRAEKVWEPGNHDLSSATKRVKWYKRRGWTAWVVDQDGRFVPIPGAMREPK